jgi:uncharacterized membrane protein YkgB
MILTRPTGRHHQVQPRTQGISLVATIIGVCVLAVIVTAVMASMGGASATPAPVATTVPVVRDTTMTPQTRAFLAEMYRKGVGPHVLDAKQAVLVATAVCELNRKDRVDRVSLPTLGLTVGKMIPKLTRIQAAEFVDDAVKYYCP